MGGAQTGTYQDCLHYTSKKNITGCNWFFSFQKCTWKVTWKGTGNLLPGNDQFMWTFNLKHQFNALFKIRVIWVGGVEDNRQLSTWTRSHMFTDWVSPSWHESMLSMIHMSHVQHRTQHESKQPMMNTIRMLQCTEQEVHDTQNTTIHRQKSVGYCPSEPRN